MVKDPARDCQMPPLPARRPVRSRRYSSVADRTACPTSREGEAHFGRGIRVRQADLVERHRAAELLTDGGRDEVRGAAPCGTIPFDTQRATDVLS